jgi:WD40 repeat protein
VLQTIDGLELSGWSGSTLLASRDGRYLCWLAGPNGLRLFEIEMGREISMPGARPVRVVDPSPDGTDHERTEHRIEATAAAFLDDSRVAYLNRFENGDLLHLMRLPGGQQEARQLARPILDSGGSDVVITYEPSWLAIARNGRLLAGSGGLPDDNSRTVIWDVAKARLRELTAPALDSPEWLQWSRSGLIVWSGLGIGVHGWDDRAGKPVRFGKSRYFADAVGLSSDGTRLAASGLTLSLLDPATGRELASRDREISTNTAVAITADGSTLAFASAETHFGVFNNRLQLERRLEPFDDKTRVEHPAFSLDGRWIAAGIGGPRNMLRVWSVLDGEVMPVTLDQSGITYGPQPPAFSTDSRRLASFLRGKSLTIWKTGSWEIERSWTLKDRGRSLAFAPGDSRLAIASDGEAAIWNADKGSRLVTFSSPGSSEMTQIAWSPDGQRVLTVADDGVLRFWRAADGQLLASLYMFDVGDDWLLVTPDGRLDGSTRALRRLVAWRVGERVSVDGALTRRHRVAGLWRALSR